MKRTKDRSCRGFSHVILPLAALVVSITSAHAQITSAQQSAMRSNCRSDFMSHCSGVSPGGKEALQCLQKNVASLSAGCQKVVSETLPKPAPAPKTEAAPPPAQEAAPPKAAETTAPAPAPAPKAALAHPSSKAATQPEPRTEMKVETKPVPKPAAKPAAKPAPKVAAASGKPTAAQQSAMRSACRSDFMSHCSGVTPGGAEALQCLQKNVGGLSASCRKVVSETMPPQAAPATAAVAAPPAAAAPQPRAEPTPAFVPGAAVIAKACARDLLFHCPGQAGGGRGVACLRAYRDSGHRLGFRCDAALKLTKQN